MGVTMVGIHERAGREKIFAQGIARMLHQQSLHFTRRITMNHVLITRVRVHVNVHVNDGN
jgi:hypothetical protein